MFGDGSAARDYTYIDNVIDGVVAACQRVQPGDFAIYNLGGSRTTTLRRLVDLISGARGRPAEVRWKPDQPGDVPITFADVSLAARDLDYTPKTGIEEGIGKFVTWFLAEGKAWLGEPNPSS